MPRISTEKLYNTVSRAKLYDAEYHLKNSYLSNLLKTPDAIDEYKEQLAYLEKYDNNRVKDTYVTLRHIFNEFGYIDTYTMQTCIADVNKYHNSRKKIK